MNELLQVLSMLAIPTGVLLTCRYFNRRAEPTRAVGRRDSDGRDVFIKPFEFDQFQAKLDAFAARADALKSAARADQSLIDAPFGGNAAAPAAAESLPKGLGVETGRLVLDAVRSAGYRVA